MSKTWRSNIRLFAGLKGHAFQKKLSKRSKDVNGKITFGRKSGKLVVIVVRLW